MGTSDPRPHTLVGLWLCTLFMADPRAELFAPMMNRGNKGWNHDEAAVVEAACEIAVKRFLSSGGAAPGVSAAASLIREACPAPDVTQYGQAEMEAVIRAALGDKDVDLSGITPGDLFEIHGVVATYFARTRGLSDTEIVHMTAQAENMAIDRGWHPPLPRNPPGPVPDDGEMHIAGTGMSYPGRQLCAASGAPVVWVSDRAVGGGWVWAAVAERSAESGLQPFLLSGMDGDTTRPWDSGEQVGEPQDTIAIDAMDAAQVLASWWSSSEEDFAEDEELREELAPFGARFPGLAPAVEEDLDPELMRRAMWQYTRDARIGLVPAARPADILPRMGWAGAANHRTASELAVVLRSWEDRFGARLLEVGFDDIRLLVSRPPQTLEAALPIAAEHFAFSDEAHQGLRGVGRIARVIVNNPFWDFWWD